MSNILSLKLKRIDPVKWGIIVGLLYAILSLVVMIPMFGIMSLTGGALANNAGGLGFLFGSGIAVIFIAPIIYGVLGFIFGVIGAAILNFILKRTKGLDMDFEKVGLDISNIGNESR